MAPQSGLGYCYDRPDHVFWRNVEDLEIWPEKVVIHSKWGLMTSSSGRLENSNAESYKVRAQIRGFQGNNTSNWARARWDILGKNESVF